LEFGIDLYVDGVRESASPGNRSLSSLIGFRAFPATEIVGPSRPAIHQEICSLCISSCCDGNWYNRCDVPLALNSFVRFPCINPPTRQRRCRASKSHSSDDPHNRFHRRSHKTAHSCETLFPYCKLHDIGRRRMTFCNGSRCRLGPLRHFRRPPWRSGFRALIYYEEMVYDFTINRCAILFRHQGDLARWK
jgi:hypothetical protein